MSERAGPLEAALQYLARGWCPMAIPPRSKERLRKWRHLQGQRPSREEVERDFAVEGEGANVAIIGGTVSGGLVFLDVDGAEAEGRVRELNPPATLTVKTARGRHLYFRTKDKVATRRIGLGNGGGLELRGEGAYVLAPHSVHPSGFRYAPEDPAQPVAELPEAVLTLFGVTASAHQAAAEANPEQVPERWLRLVESNPRTRAAWEGQGEHHDQTGSGRDMYLAHEIRRCGFGPEEARRILRAAPYPVGGGRPASYLDRTLAKAYKAGQRRQLPAYGIAPAGPVDDRTFARLAPASKALYHVLLVRRMRPSGVVVRSVELLAVDAGISVKSVGPAGAKLEKAGLLQRHRVAGGRMQYRLFLPPDKGGMREAQAGPGPEDEPPLPQAPRPHEGLAAPAFLPPVQGGVRDEAGPSAGPMPGLLASPPVQRGMSPPVKPGVREIPSPPVQGGVRLSLVTNEEEGSGMAATETASLPARPPCHVCGGGRWWRSSSGVWLCTTCHPPADPVLVAEEVGQ